MSGFWKSQVKTATASLIYWKVSLVRCVIYSGIVMWGMFKAGTQGYDSLSDMSSMQLLYLFGDMLFSGFCGVLLAFIDNTLSGLGRRLPPAADEPAPDKLAPQPKEEPVKTMQSLIKIVTVAALLTCGAAKADTNAPPFLSGGFTEILKSAGLVTDPTNYAVVPFYGRSTDGKKSAVGLVAIENVTANVGVIGGIDTLWGGGKVGSANIVAGGVTLKEALHPLKFTGLGSWTSNFVATPFAIAMVGTPIRGTGNADGGLASITRLGANFDVVNVKGWQFGLGVDYGRRSGSGNYNGNWIDVLLSIRKGF